MKDCFFVIVNGIPDFSMPLRPSEADFFHEQFPLVDLVSSVELSEGLYGPPPTDEELEAMAQDYEANVPCVLSPENRIALPV